MTMNAKICLVRRTPTLQILSWSAIISCLLFFGYPLAAKASSPADILIQSDGIYVMSLVADIEVMTLRLSDPNGRTIVNERSDGSSILWVVPVDTPDGEYMYEVRVIVATGVSEKRVVRQRRRQNAYQEILNQSGVIRIEC